MYDIDKLLDPNIIIYFILQTASTSDLGSVCGDVTPRGGRSRASSISSMTSDSSFFPSVSFSQHHYMPSDAESEIEDSSVNLSAISKEDLYAFVKRFERRAFKYKTKFMEVSVIYMCVGRDGTLDST